MKYINEVNNKKRDIMEPFTKHTGIAAPLDRANIDTDAIIPKQFLRKIESSDLNKKPLDRKNVTLLDNSNYQPPHAKPILIHFWATLKTSP